MVHCDTAARPLSNRPCYAHRLMSLYAAREAVGMMARRTAAGCGVITGLLIGVATLGAWSGQKATTHLTFNTPIGLPGVALGAGTYVFQIETPNTNLDAVRVTDESGKRTYFMGYTVEVVRPKELPDDRQI